MCRRSWLYWSELDAKQSTVKRSSLNGTDVSVLTSRIQTPNGLHLDVELQVLYVLDGVNGSLYSCPLNTSYSGETMLTTILHLRVCPRSDYVGSVGSMEQRTVSSA